MQTTTTTQAPADAEGYDDMLRRIQARLERRTRGGAEPVFTTDASGLFHAYLDTLPFARNYHDCHACQHFIERFGGLVVLDERGVPTPALWAVEDAAPYYRAGIEAMARVVRKARVTGVLRSDHRTLGTPSNPKNEKHGGEGYWTHFHLELPERMVHRDRHRTAHQAAAEKLEDFRNVSRALGAFSHDMLATAVGVLKSDALYRSEKVLGAAEWLLELQGARSKGNRHNVTWRAVALAPAGFCHPRSSMIGTLLEDLERGLSFDEVSRRFAEKMHPLAYQRPKAAPTAGAIAQAEELFQDLGLAPALRRRFARAEEVDALWRPRGEEPAQAGGVFGHLVPKAQEMKRSMGFPRATMTWAKFEREVLPEATGIEFLVPRSGNFCALTTAVDPEAPPLLRWDREEQRNPVSLYLYASGSYAHQWHLDSGWTPVTAICLRPHQWYGGGLPNATEGVIFLLEGARDLNNHELALFPETLRSELHGVRSVIEAHSKHSKLEGVEDASACGYVADKGRSWDSIVLRVTTASFTREYQLDRWD